MKFTWLISEKTNHSSLLMTHSGSSPQHNTKDSPSFLRILPASASLPTPFPHFGGNQVDHEESQLLLWETLTTGLTGMAWVIAHSYTLDFGKAGVLNSGSAVSPV